MTSIERSQSAAWAAWVPRSLRGSYSPFERGIPCWQRFLFQSVVFCVIFSLILTHVQRKTKCSLDCQLNANHNSIFIPIFVPSTFPQSLFLSFPFFFGPSLGCFAHSLSHLIKENFKHFRCQFVPTFRTAPMRWQSCRSPLLAHQKPGGEKKPRTKEKKRRNEMV